MSASPLPPRYRLPMVNITVLILNAPQDVGLIKREQFEKLADTLEEWTVDSAKRA